MKPLAILFLFCASVASAQERQRPLVLVTNCVWVADKNNDGDSFRISTGASNFTVRLYDVDCPDLKPISAQRHAAQTNHFKADGERLIEIGRVAARFTSNQLARPFSIITRYAHSYGGPRVLAYAITCDGADLGAMLISNNFAHANGGKYNPPPAALVRGAK